MNESKQARRHDELIAELLDSRVPKTELEHAAAREIERLRSLFKRRSGWAGIDGRDPCNLTLEVSRMSERKNLDRAMTEYRTTCKDCGEYLEGDGFKRVIHCPNIEELGCYEPDAGPIYCGEGVGLNELLAVNARLGKKR